MGRQADAIGCSSANMMEKCVEPAVWQRVSPVAVIYFTLKGVVDLIRNGWQGLAGLAAALSFGGETLRTLLLVGGVGGLVTVLLASALLRYWFFRFRLGADRFDVTRGVFKRRTLTLAFDRVQNVAIVQPFYFRPFGLVILRLESAGSSAQEVDIAGVSDGFARDAKSRILQSRRAAVGATAVASSGEDRPDRTAAAEAGSPLVHQPVSELVRHGLASNNVWLFAAIGASILGAVTQDDDRLVTPELEAALSSLFSHGAAASALIIIAAAIVLLAGFTLLSVVAAVILHYDFRLFREESGLRRRAGLFETREAALSDGKIQCLSIRQSPVARLMQRSDMAVIQVGGRSDQRGRAGKQTFLIPSLTESQTDRLIAILYPPMESATPRRCQIHPFYVVRTFLYFWLLPFGAAASLIALAEGPWAMALLIVPILALPFIVLHRRRIGYARCGDFGLVDGGLLDRQRTLFPLFKVQTIQIAQSPSQRRRRLATLTLSLAGRTLRIPFMPLEDARQWRDLILYRVEASRTAWM